MNNKKRKNQLEFEYGSTPNDDEFRPEFADWSPRKLFERLLFKIKSPNKPASEFNPEKPLAANCVKALIALGDNCESACKAVRSLWFI